MNQDDTTTTTLSDDAGGSASFAQPLVQKIGQTTAAGAAPVVRAPGVVMPDVPAPGITTPQPAPAAPVAVEIK
jgi:chemotaxis protein MotB